MNTIDKLYKALQEEFIFEGATGKITFNLRDYEITVEQNNVIGNILEEWLDKIEETIEYKAWYCGHWHINKRIDKMHFLFHNFEINQDLDIYG